MTLLAKAMLGLIWIYQHLWAPHSAAACRFVPSCSQFAREAVHKHGAARGSWLVVRRIARCHPLGSSGYDPVP